MVSCSYLSSAQGFLGALVGDDSTPTNNQQTKNKVMNVDVKIIGDKIMISNNAGQRGDDGQNDIHGIMVYINGRPYTDEGYRYGVGDIIKSKDSIFLDLNQFHKSDGRRFDIERYEIISMWIGGGEGHYDYQKFGGQ